jgi:hypothetical protein
MKALGVSLANDGDDVESRRGTIVRSFDRLRSIVQMVMKQTTKIQFDELYSTAYLSCTALVYYE